MKVSDSNVNSISGVMNRKIMSLILQRFFPTHQNEEHCVGRRSDDRSRFPVPEIQPLFLQGVELGVQILGSADKVHAYLLMFMPKTSFSLTSIDEM